MEHDAGRPGQNPDPKPSPPSTRPLARSPLVPRPAGKGIRSAPDVLPPAGRVGGKPRLLPMDAPEPRKRFNRVGFYLAIAIALGTIPFTCQFQKNRARPKGADAFKTNYDIPIERRQWRMHGLVDDTEKQVIDRFGKPYLSRNFNMSDGAFVGPTVGQKRYYARTLPDFEARTAEKEDTVVWTFPQYAVIREVIWEFPDSYLTVWMREPRAEMDISDEQGITRLPIAPEGGGDWVVIDNFRVGRELIKTPPAAASPTPGRTP